MTVYFFAMAIAVSVTGCSGSNDAGADGITAGDVSGENDAGMGASPASDAAPSDLNDLDGGSSPPSISWNPAEGLGACEATDSPAPDPVQRTANLTLARAAGSPRIVHLLDIEGDPNTGLIYSVGAGGLFVLSSDGSSLEVVTNTNLAGIRGSFDKVEVLNEGIIALSSRNRGLTFVDGSTPGELRQLSTFGIDDAAGMAWNNPYLYVASHVGKVSVLDLSVPESPTLVGEVGDLGNPWEIVAIGQRAYVADNSLGVVVLDLSDPVNPIALRTVETSGGAQDLWLDGDTLFVAAGSAGIESFSLVDPDDPTALSLIDVGSSIVSLTVTEDTLWASDHESLIAIDVSDPATPLPLGGQRTDQWAMHVYASGGYAYVADWGQVSAFSIDLDRRGPDLDVSRRELFIVEGDEEITFSITNRGSEPLQLLGASVDDPRFQVEYEHAELDPGQSGSMRLLFLDDGAMVNASLCLATNDGDEGVFQIPILTNPSGTSAGLGEQAPDFVLRDIDGQTHQLSEQLGHPVVLVYFATW